MNARLVPAVIDPAQAALLRARFDRIGYARYALLDRGSYDFIDAPDISELRVALERIVEGTIASARILRLHPGDYLLTRHDRVHDDRPTELVLDLSESPVPEAEVHWRHRGQVFFTMPSHPGSAAVVERGPTVMCNHTYVTKRQSNSVVRLIVIARRSRSHT